MYMYVYLYMEPVASGGLFFFKIKFVNVYEIVWLQYGIEAVFTSVHSFYGEKSVPFIVTALFDTESLWIIHQSNHVEN